MAIAISRQFAEWVTRLKADPFVFARLKLTAQFMLGMCLILVVFNLLIFQLFVIDFPPELETVASDHAETVLKQALYLADALILLLVGAMSYFLAGRALAPIREVYNRQKKFVADAAHDLRTPLAILRSGAELALSGTQDIETYRAAMTSSIDEVDQLSHLASDLLFLAKRDGGQRHNYKYIDLADLISAQVKPISLLAPSGIDIKWELCESCQIRGDRSLLIRMVRNLLQNALDHNQPGGTVFVRLDCSQDQVVLEVADTGVGISPSDTAHIFERFYKADTSRGGDTGGSGLGLSIVKEIVVAHGGIISVSSVEGQGSSFTIKFVK